MKTGKPGNEYDIYQVSFDKCKIMCDYNRTCTGFEHYSRVMYPNEHFNGIMRNDFCEIWYHPSSLKLTQPVNINTSNSDAWCYWKN